MSRTGAKKKLDTSKAFASVSHKRRSTLIASNFSHKQKQQISEVRSRTVKGARDRDESKREKIDEQMRAMTKSAQIGRPQSPIAKKTISTMQETLCRMQEL